MNMILGSPADYNTYAISKRLGAINKFVSFEGKVILDIGCGNGAYTMEMAQNAKIVVGIDVERERLLKFSIERERRQTNNVFIVQMDGQELAFADNSFDIVTCIETLEHVPDELRLLGEISRVLKPGGAVALSLPNKWYLFETHGARVGKLKLSNRIPFVSWLPAGLHSRIAPARIYTKTRAVSLIKRAGFKNIHVDYIYPPVDRLPIGYPLRSLLRGVGNTLERTFAKVFGVSIICVAQKF